MASCIWYGFLILHKVITALPCTDPFLLAHNTNHYLPFITGQLGKHAMQGLSFPAVVVLSLL
jgi:hypothetical protein